MRRSFLFLLSLTVACGLLPRASVTPTAVPTAAPTATRLPATATATGTPRPNPTNTHTPLPPTATATVRAATGLLTADDVIFHPDPRLYSGDIVSLEALAPAPPPPGWEAPPVKMSLDDATGQPPAQHNLARYGLGGRPAAA